MHDLIIIGAGPAGLTAAIYAARFGIHPLVLEAAVPGGQVVTSEEIENYPGVERIEGWRFAENLKKHAVGLGAEIRIEKVTGFEIDGEQKTIITGKNSYIAKTVIIANGVKRRKIGCPGEDEFMGRGVSYCAICDGNFFRNKTVCVIGGGNTALEDALFLSKICKKVYIVHRRDDFRANNELVVAIKSKDNIEIIYSCVPKDISGDKKVSGITLENKMTSESLQLELDGVFVAIGLEPDNTLFTPYIEVDKNGYIAAGEDCTTKIPGVYAVGDTRTKTLRQIVTAASDGATAATAAAEFIQKV